jgi:uncharacterized protein (DUF302 family)
VNVDGLVTLESAFSVQKTMDRLVDRATSSGLQIFARIDHAKGAQEAGLDLRPTELLVFGNPRGGTALMQDRQTAAIDLPVKALVWEDEQGRVWLGYNDATWIARRHGLTAASAGRVQAINAGLAALAAATTSP